MTTSRSYFLTFLQHIFEKIMYIQYNNFLFEYFVIFLILKIWYQLNLFSPLSITQCNMQYGPNVVHVIYSSCALREHQTE